MCKVRFWLEIEEAYNCYFSIYLRRDIGVMLLIRFIKKFFDRISTAGNRVRTDPGKSWKVLELKC